MKILASEVNKDGNYELLVEFQETRTQRQTAIIASREIAISQGNKDLEKVSDDDYLKSAIEKLAEQLEVGLPVEPAMATRAAAMVGKIVTKKPGKK